MKLSLVAAAAIAAGRPALVASSNSPALDLSLDLEESPSINKSPGALAIIAAAEREPGIRTAMVVENGKVVASYIRDDVDPDEPVNTWSVTKSIASLLMGILLDEGALSSVQETLGEIFPDESTWEGVPDADFRKAVTIYEMLTMTSGLIERGEMAIYHSDEVCKDGLKFWLKDPLVDPELKGEWNYLVFSGILSYVIMERTGMTPRELLAEKVLSPLGIQDSEIGWETKYGQCEHTETTSGGLQLTTTQMAKIGLLYLARGAAGPNKTVVSSDYIDESLTEHVLMKTVFGLPVQTPNPNPGYGYRWIKDVQKYDGFENWGAIGVPGHLILIDHEQGRVSVQQFDGAQPPANELVDPEWPALVGMDPSLSFEGTDTMSHAPKGWS